MIYWLSHGKKSVQKKKWEVNEGNLPSLTSHFIFWALISMSLTIKKFRSQENKYQHLNYIPHDLLAISW